MAKTAVSIGARDYTVACRDGEERFLKNAAALLDAEAKAIVREMERGDRMPETQMLLMAGLMLADKTASLQEKLRLAEEKLAAAETLVSEYQGGDNPTVEVMPEGLADRLRALTEKAEAIAGP